MGTQNHLNLPVGAQVSAAITTNATTVINVGKRAVLAGYVVMNAGSAWTVQFYNGNPASGGVALGPAMTIAAGMFALPLLAAPAGLYAVTAGTTAGSMTVAFYG